MLRFVLHRPQNRDEGGVQVLTSDTIHVETSGLYQVPSTTCYDPLRSPRTSLSFSALRCGCEDLCGARFRLLPLGDARATLRRAEEEGSLI